MKLRHIIVLLFISIVPLIIFRDFTPSNELRYLNIADEAIANGNIFAFYDHGAPYADKPPLYLWIVMLGKLLFGEHIMLFVALFSVIPALITISVMNKFTSTYLKEDQVKSASLMLFTSAFFLAASIVLRMDMLMTMFIVLSLYVFFRMYNETKENGKPSKKDRILLPVYIFMAIFSKGAVGILVPLMTILIFIGINSSSLKNFYNQICNYLGWRTWAILFALCSVWFTGVWFDGGKEYLNNLLFHQTINRAVDAFHHKKPFWYYCRVYWLVIAPWALFVITVAINGVVQKIKHNNLEKLFAVAICSTFIMLSIISSKIEIYLLPIIPFMIYYGIMRFTQIKNNIYVKISVIIPGIVLIIPFIGAVLFFIFKRDFFPMIPDESIKEALSLFSVYITLITFTGVLAFGAVQMIIKSGNDLLKGVRIFSASFLIFMFGMSFLVPAFNRILGLYEATVEAFEITVPENISYYDFRSGPNIDVYIKKLMKKSGLYTKDQIEKYTIEQRNREWLEGYIKYKDSLSKVHGKHKNVLFIKTRDMKRDSLLIKAMGDYPRKNFGEYSFVTAP